MVLGLPVILLSGLRLGLSSRPLMRQILAGDWSGSGRKFFHSVHSVAADSRIHVSCSVSCFIWIDTFIVFVNLEKILWFLILQGKFKSVDLKDTIWFLNSGQAAGVSSMCSRCTGN